MIESDKNQHIFTFDVEGGNFNAAGTVSTRIKSLLKQLQMPDDVVRRSAIVSYEAEINIVSYAKKGVIRITVSPDQVMIEADDTGQGIPDINLAMQQGYSTANHLIREMGFGAGMGLFNIKSYSDKFDITSEVDKGTFLRIIIKEHVT
ncbi:MAG TPA: ATP-binding protein [Smithella sp.]|nr:ATP-binding protein [Smithella sp.]HNQ65101.1 ATP-binding protein [Smithella sp.]HOE32995.1 ATP-binding protein [Smithella sp.]HOG10816.1 ATP-binding protein [Smithella sp.]HOO34673.1 ATP-binding protein [Smithella sp.]